MDARVGVLQRLAELLRRGVTCAELIAEALHTLHGLCDIGPNTQQQFEVLRIGQRQSLSASNSSVAALPPAFAAVMAISAARRSLRSRRFAAA
ncbi:hypothetical protein [Dyella japonica]|uniref:Uncharacterized protein n=1 Tax=Dyella japonica TaxID=231455 RepID=A0ABV2JUG1_9GAMM